MNQSTSNKNYTIIADTTENTMPRPTKWIDAVFFFTETPDVETGTAQHSDA